MKKKLTLTITAVVLAASLTSGGCGRGGFLLARTLVTVAAVATVLAWHDAHYHHHHCGHEYVYVEERPVYRYQGRWEYYDPDSGRWYMYEELPR